MSLKNSDSSEEDTQIGLSSLETCLNCLTEWSQQESMCMLPPIRGVFENSLENTLKWIK